MDMLFFAATSDDDVVNITLDMWQPLQNCVHCTLKNSGCLNGKQEYLNRPRWVLINGYIYPGIFV